MILDSDLNVFNRSDYQRYNFDKFLHHIKFKYNVKSVHIGGTNGKGSVARYLANIYSYCGYKVGLFTSPFFNYVNEMISINGQFIEDTTFTNYLSKYIHLFKKFDLSRFEIETFVALSYFNDNNCDIAIIECGMGGEEDATNVFDPILSVITSISLEHTSYLGKTLSEIALNKAGIIKREIPVLVGNLPVEAMHTIKDVALSLKSPLYQVDMFYDVKYTDDGICFLYKPYGELIICSNAYFSINDACIALEGITILRNLFPIDEDKLKLGLKMTNLNLVLEKISSNPIIYLDGAHNKEAIVELCDSISKIAQNKPIHIIFACFKDKNVEAMLNELALISDDLCLSTFPHKRSRTMDDYFLFLEDYKFYPNYKDLIKEKLTLFGDDIILITGSIAFVSLVKNDFLNEEFNEIKLLDQN